MEWLRIEECVYVSNAVCLFYQTLENRTISLFNIGPFHFPTATIAHPFTIIYEKENKQ
jgi:hypothetical protein